MAGTIPPPRKLVQRPACSSPALSRRLSLTHHTAPPPVLVRPPGSTTRRARRERQEKQGKWPRAAVDLGCVAMLQARGPSLRAIGRELGVSAMVVSRAISAAR